MKNTLQYIVIIIVLLIQTLIAKASDFNIDEATKLQYSAPRSAIQLLLSTRESFSLMDNEEFLTHQLLLFRLSKKVENIELANQTFQRISERLSLIESYKPWIKVLSLSLLFYEQKYIEADEVLQSIPVNTISNKSDVFKMWFYFYSGALKVRQNLYEMALEDINKANNLAINLDDKYIQMEVISRLIVIDYYQQQYENSLEKSNTLQALAKSLNDDFMEVVALSNIVNVYHLLVIKQDTLIERSNDEKEIQRLLKIKNDYRIKSKLTLDKTLIKSRDIGFKKFELKVLISLQNYYLENHSYKETIVVGNEIIALAQKPDQLCEKAGAYNNISIAYRALKKYDESILALQAAESIYHDIQNEQSLLWIFEGYSLTYEASGNHELALAYFKTLHQKTLDLQKKTNNRNVLELQETFQHEININKIEKLSHQHQLNTRQLEVDEFQKGIFISFGLILLLIIFLIFKDKRIISQKNDLLDEFNIKLKEQTLKDPLTGLFNRRLLSEIKSQLLTPITAINQNACLKNNIGLVILDIDLFKKINDSLGHDIGDLVIQQVSKELLNSTKEKDYVIRWGGEEFLIILMDTTKKGVDSFCKKILTQRNNNPIKISTHSLDVTFSLGFISSSLVKSNSNWFSWDDSLKLIDNCLYLAKKKGRNKAISVTVEDEQATDEHKKILLELLSNEGYELPKTLKLEVIQGESSK